MCMYISEPPSYIVAKQEDLYSAKYNAISQVHLEYSIRAEQLLTVCLVRTATGSWQEIPSVLIMILSGFLAFD